MSPKNLKLILVESQEQKATFAEIIEKYHSYVPHTRHIGRRLDYLVMNDDSPVGAVGLGSMALPQGKAVCEYFRPILGVTRGKVVFKPIFNNIADNWRFCLTPEAPQNSGSRVLSVLVKVGARDWKAKYKDDLVWVMTYVEDAHAGTIYKASGWNMVGITGGVVPKRDFKEKWGSSHWADFGAQKVPKKKVFIKLVGKIPKLGWKIEFIRGKAVSVPYKI